MEKKIITLIYNPGECTLKNPTLILKKKLKHYVFLKCCYTNRKTKLNSCCATKNKARKIEKGRENKHIKELEKSNQSLKIKHGFRARSSASWLI